MDNDAIDIAEQFEKHLNSPKQTWLLGAGVSFQSNIPLMYPLTERVFHIALNDTYADDETSKNIIEFIKNDITASAHIEIFLTHLSDLISMAERARDHSVQIGDTKASKAQLTTVHLKLLELIAETVRWGFKPAIKDGDGTETEPEQIGNPSKSITKIEAHKDFINAIFGTNRAGLEKHRDAVEFFTTNYDTLIEDALALNQIVYNDGFTGGAVAFWDNKHNSSEQACVTKLHGSIDWFRSTVAPSPLIRTRNGDTYHNNESGAVMIYPQAAKYMNAQENPFAQLFQKFRHTLANGTDQVLLICGYSFGDDHINADIELAMSKANSQLTIIAFAGEMNNELPKTVRRHIKWHRFKPVLRESLLTYC